MAVAGMLFSLQLLKNLAGLQMTDQEYLRSSSQVGRPDPGGVCLKRTLRVISKCLWTFN